MVSCCRHLTCAAFRFCSLLIRHEFFLHAASSTESSLARIPPILLKAGIWIPYFSSSLFMLLISSSGTDKTVKREKIHVVRFKKGEKGRGVGAEWVSEVRDYWRQTVPGSCVIIGFLPLGSRTKSQAGYQQMGGKYLLLLMSFTFAVAPQPWMIFAVNSTVKHSQLYTSIAHTTGTLVAVLI